MKHNYDLLMINIYVYILLLFISLYLYIFIWNEQILKISLKTFYLKFLHY